MKVLLFIFFISFSLCSSFSQEIIYLDDEGNKINKTKFRKNWGDKELLLTRWDSIGIDNIRYATLKEDLYNIANCDYQNAKQQLEKIIKRQIPDNSNIIIEFYYKDDLCTTWWSNKWSKETINKRKEFTNPIKYELSKSNFFYIALFENGIELKNNPKNENEYFFVDEKNYFKNFLFKNPTLCGSYALIKNNGDTLIRNGEYRADWMAQHLLPENWNLFFESKD